MNFVRISNLNLTENFIDEIIKSSLESIDIPKNVNIQWSPSNVKITCDFRKMEAVLLNIITNAIAAINEDGNVKIKVRDYSDTIEIEIEDSGPGVEPDLESKIFEPMFTTKIHGSGLGLPICKMIVEQHGGSMIIKHHPSAFTVILPKVKPKVEPTA